eukprot:210200_1
MAYHNLQCLLVACLLFGEPTYAPKIKQNNQHSQHSRRLPSNKMITPKTRGIAGKKAAMEAKWDKTFRSKGAPTPSTKGNSKAPSNPQTAQVD